MRATKAGRLQYAFQDKQQLLARRAKVTERARNVLRFLLTGLDATTSYNEPLTARTPRYKGATTLYGWQLALTPDTSKLLGPDGKPTAFMLTRQWTAQPGEIVTSRQLERNADGDLRARRYMVRPDRSLRRI